ncbi:hypothetical protein [Microbulbifer variabilis]|uniref:hypothetical protein n=1 Tax=Microbulbifer variabilis TaxID=266805 RepID=UPI001CFEBA4F|nr:hypothetical protein [Microbulbifer variabilis]
MQERNLTKPEKSVLYVLFAWSLLHTLGVSIFLVNHEFNHVQKYIYSSNILTSIAKGVVALWLISDLLSLCGFVASIVLRVKDIGAHVNQLILLAFGALISSAWFFLSLSTHVVS